ncbi:serine/threonine-protein phosphatase 4 regulatory subunit 2 isoform X1 [Gossypium australe]|uniref:Serine/threonine-protein phosphatase 4 regulatory subunit 2 isoform X1 n=3 Tax=Gossypium TaxID=3633 RepID=A0A5B6UYM6_9ROSI|nr:serine/threonine-protein phosphatase 4 regulatory subunit 2 isoform X1 [Gossypium australe]
MSKAEEEPIREIMTDEEMNNLATKLVSLLEELPENISNFLKEHCSSGGGQMDGEPIDIDVDALSNETLYKLRKLLDDYLLEKQAKQAKAESREKELLDESGFSNLSIQSSKGMEASSVTENSSTGNDHEQEPGLNHGGTESNPETNRDEEELDGEQVRRVLQVSAATGKFWHNWDKLKSMLSFQLKLVLSEYPEAKMTIEQQNASLGETYLELVTRLNEELHSFIEGPPFTLQRLCEHSLILCKCYAQQILLDARSIYPKLSKLALALEKNLLVTSTLTVCTEPYPEMMPNPEPEKATEEAPLQSNSVQNGVESMVGDRDEIMTEVEADIEEMTIDVDAFQEMVGPSEANSTAAENS